MQLCTTRDSKNELNDLLQLLLYCLLTLIYSGCYTDRYLQVVPWGFRKMLNWIAKEYNNPTVLITENGFSDRGELNDGDRVDYHIVSGSNSGLFSKVVYILLLEAIHRNYSESVLANRRFNPNKLYNYMLWFMWSSALTISWYYIVLKEWLH
jgi:hypothetical protein